MGRTGLIFSFELSISFFIDKLICKNIVCKNIGWFAQLLVHYVAAVKKISFSVLKRFHFKFCQAVKIFVSENNIMIK